jgi:WD40 repeat protein
VEGAQIRRSRMGYTWLSAVRCSGQPERVVPGQQLPPENSHRNSRVYEFGRTGKANVAMGVAVGVLVIAIGLFVFFSPKRSETPVEPTRELGSDALVLTKLAIADSGEALAAATANGDVLVWRLPGRRLTVVGKPTDSPATMLEWSPDGLLLCGDSSGLLRAWQQPELEGSLIDSPRVAVTACVFRQKLADKQMLLGLSDGRIVTVAPSETTLRDSGHRGLKALLISTDQKTLVSVGSEGKVIWYDFKQDEIVGTASEHETEIAALAWSPDGAQFASADWNGELRIWDTKQRKLVAEASQPDAVSALAWTADRIVTGSWDGRIRVWNVESNQLELAFSIYTGLPIHDLVVESSGETAFTVSGDGSVREWTLSKAQPSQSGD